MSTIKPIIINYEASNINSYIIEISYDTIRFYTNHGIMIKNDEVYEIESPYKYKDLFDEKGLPRISHTQNGDYLYLFHPKYPIKTIYRRDSDWYIENFDIKAGPWGAVNTSSVRLSYDIDETDITKITSAGADGWANEGMVGKYIRLTLEDTAIQGWVANKSYNDGEYVFSDGKYYKTESGGTSGSIKPVHTYGARSDGGVKWVYKHSGYGIALITRYISDSTVEATFIGEFPEELDTDSTRYWELSVFGGDCVYPTSGVFHLGRLAIIADTNNIPTVYLSCSDDYNNFADKTYGDVLDTNAITIPLYSNEYATSSFLVSSSVLFAGTSGGEFAIDKASSSEPLSPSNVQYKQFSNFGSLPIKPVKCGASIFYVSKQGVSIRNILYSFEKDGYESLEISLFGKHLLYKGIKKIVYQELPNKVIWIVTNGGDLIGITYMLEQQVCAFHRHNLSGLVEDIAVIPNQDNNYEDLWLVVNREDTRCIEWMDIGLSEDETEYFFVDSGLLITREFSKDFSGVVSDIAGNLKGKEVFGQEGSNRFTYIDTNLGNRTFKVHGEEVNNELAHCYIYWNITSEDDLNYRLALSQDLVGLNVKVNHFYTLGGKREVETLIDGFATSTYVNFVPTIKGTDNEISIVITKMVNRDDVTLSGLDHLEGKFVAIMIDGAEHSQQIVTNGQIVVPYYAKNVIVGLPINSMFIPQNLYLQSDMSSGVGDVQRIDHITLMLHKSMGGNVGQDDAHLFPIYFRDTDEIMDYVTPLYSGNKKVFVDFNTSTIKEKGATIVIQNDSVFPMNILAIAPTFSTSGGGL